MRRFKYWRLRRAPFHRRFPSRSDFVLNHVDRRMAVNRARGYIYFRIPKAANSTISLRLAQESDPAIDNAEDAKRWFLRGRDLVADEVARLRERFLLFTFAREPYARLASSYLDKVERMKGRQTRALAASHSLDDTPLSFLEFCRHLQRNGVYEDPHWFPQTTFIPCGVDQLHIIGRCEDLDATYDDISRRIARGSKGARPGRGTWDSHRTGAEQRLVDLYCTESLDIVRGLYAADFDALGYDPCPEWSRALGAAQ